MVISMIIIKKNSFFPPPLYLSLFLFLEFIKCVCELRWMCCGGGVAYYVECANVVKKE